MSGILTDGKATVTISQTATSLQSGLPFCRSGKYPHVKLYLMLKKFYYRMPSLVSFVSWSKQEVFLHITISVHEITLPKNCCLFSLFKKPKFSMLLTNGFSQIITAANVQLYGDANKDQIKVFFGFLCNL